MNALTNKFRAVLASIALAGYVVEGIREGIQDSNFGILTVFVGGVCALAIAVDAWIKDKSKDL